MAPSHLRSSLKSGEVKCGGLGKLSWPSSFPKGVGNKMPGNRSNWFTNYGIGIGLLARHYGHILSQTRLSTGFAIISENFMIEGGRPLHILDQILDHYKVVEQGVSM
jgi:hypothetical protein